MEDGLGWVWRLRGGRVAFMEREGGLGSKQSTTPSNHPFLSSYVSPRAANSNTASGGYRAAADAMISLAGPRFSPSQEMFSGM